jgi:DNA-nicking Smr family endonuclease
MTKSGRPLTKSEVDLWRQFTADVRPLNERDGPISVRSPSDKRSANGRKDGKAPRAAPGLPRHEQRPKRPSSEVALDPTRPIDIDRRSWERLKKGQVDIERTLDLHGRTQIEAHSALNRFLTMASAAGLRYILVVTGKGGTEGKGVLRQMVPRWLGEAGNRQKILTYCPAQPRHGGDGALYILLKRQRSRSSR